MGIIIGVIFPYRFSQKARKYKENQGFYHANSVNGAVILPDEICVSNL